MNDHEVYQAIGEEGFRSLIAAFYRQIPGDDLLGPMYAGRDLVQAEARLRDFLVFRFGGPDRYIENRGHPRLRIRHAPFAVNQAARDRWVHLMNHALEQVALPVEPAATLREFFASTATFLVNRAD
jgi:hemoglobin